MREKPDRRFRSLFFLDILRGLEQCVPRQGDKEFSLNKGLIIMYVIELVSKFTGFGVQWPNDRPMNTIEVMAMYNKWSHHYKIILKLSRLY